MSLKSKARERFGIEVVEPKRSKRRGKEANTNPLARTAAVDNYQVSKAKPRFGVAAGRTVIYVTCGVLIATGLGQLVGRPIREHFFPPNTTVAAADEINPDEARSIAGRFTADYLSFNPLSPSAGKPALDAAMVAAGNEETMTWSGSAWLAADTVIPGAVTVLDPTHSVVNVQARVQIATPSGNPPAPPKARDPLPGVLGNSQAMPDGFTPAGSQWLNLQVPVTVTELGAQVDVGGPVFAADTATPAVPFGEVDQPVTMSTRDWASTLFDAYAGDNQTNLDYLTTEGHHIHGLNGAFRFEEIQAWQAHKINPAGDGSRTASATVKWSLLPAVDLSIRQNYHVNVTYASNRWFATSITTTQPTTTGGNS